METPMQLTKTVYRIAELPEIMGIGRSRIYQEIAAGRLRMKKVGKCSLITADAIEKWLDALPEAGPEAA